MCLLTYLECFYVIRVVLELNEVNLDNETVSEEVSDTYEVECSDVIEEFSTHVLSNLVVDEELMTQMERDRLEQLFMVSFV